MRPSRILRVAAAVSVLALAAAPAALASEGDEGAPTGVAFRSAQRAVGPPPAELLQRALATCRARGYTGSLQARCATTLVANAGGGGGGAAPGGAPAPGGDQGRRPAPAPTASPQQPAPGPVGSQGGGAAQPPRAAAPVPAPQPPRGPVLNDQGIVQAIGFDGVVLRALDGSTLTIPLTPATRVYVGDRPASPGDLRPGAVATVRHQDRGPALEIRVALPPKPKLRTDRAITVSVSPGVLVVQLRDGRTVSTGLDPAVTRVQAPNGRQLAPGELVSGLLVDVLWDPAGSVPAQSVRVIRRVS